ncbi:MAG: flagellar biosynthetic protein FliR [Planctomycetes bacterium]|nr:flagellar biosynthetic protein FliR [Planctomycetota bacterium]
MDRAMGEWLEAWGGAPALAAAALVACRLGGLCLVAPFFSSRLVPPRFRIGLVGAVALLALFSEPVRSALDGSAAARALSEESGTAGWGLMLGSELLIGGALGWLILVVFAAVRGACLLISQQIGLSTDSLVDPLGGEEDPMLSRLYTALAVLAFLSLDLHLSLVGAVLESFRWVEPGGLDAGAVSSFLGQLALRTGPDLMVAAAGLALPLLLAMLLVSVAQGLLGRCLPEVELLVLGLPLRLLLGMCLLALLLPVTTGMFRSLLEGAVEDGRLFLKLVTG